MWTSYIAPRVKTTCALDLDMITLKLARLWKSPRRPIQPTDQVNFAQGSALQLPYKDSTFSKLLAVDVIEHIPDHYSAGREFARVLQPKGRLVLTTLLKNRPSYVMPMSFDDHVREYTLAELRSVVEDAGLKVAHHFYFYHKYSLIAREIQVFAANTAIGRNVVTGLGVGFLCRLIAYMETVRRVGQPAGVGIVAKAS